MQLAALPPAVVKAPPSYTSLTETASAYTALFTPEFSAFRLMPFRLAMLWAITSPTTAK